jgi:TetR/AcrR family transcriptional regulator, transcriptional repressor for nem operon
LTDRSTTLQNMSPQPDTRTRILNSARELIYTRSYADVGVAEICTQAGVKKGSFYHFFPSKQDLVLTILDEVFAELDAELFNKAFHAELPPLERLRKLPLLVAAYQDVQKAGSGHMPGCPFGNLALELSTRDETIRNKADSMFCNMEAYFIQALEEGVDAGDIGEVDVEATAQAMLGYLEGIMLLAKTRNEPELIRRLGPALADIRILKTGG